MKPPNLGRQLLLLGLLAVFASNLAGQWVNKPPGTQGTTPAATSQPAVKPAVQPAVQPPAPPAPPAPPPPPPSPFKFEPAELDLGRIRDEAPVNGKFKFTNITDHEVTVLNVTSSCGCTVVKVEKKPYASGESGEIDVQFNPAMRQGKERKPVYVETNDPKCPKSEAWMAVEVIPRIGIEPRAQWIGEVKKNETAGPWKITITARVPDFSVKSAAAKDPRFSLTQVSSEPTEIDGEKAVKLVYDLKFLGDKDVSIIQTQALFETSDAKMPYINVPLVGRVVGELRLIPDMVQLRLEKSGAPFSQPIQVSSRSNKAFKVVDAKVTGREDMKLEIVTEAADPRMPNMVRLLLKGITPELNAQTGNTFNGTITLKTDLDDQPEASIPITGFVMMMPTPTPPTPQPPQGQPTPPPAGNTPAPPPVKPPAAPIPPATPAKAGE